MKEIDALDSYQCEQCPQQKTQGRVTQCQILVGEHGGDAVYHHDEGDESGDDERGDEPCEGQEVTAFRSVHRDSSLWSGHKRDDACQKGMTKTDHPFDDKDCREAYQKGFHHQSPSSFTTRSNLMLP